MAALQTDFHRESIDFFETYEKVSAKHKVRPVCRKSFGAPIVSMAASVLTSYFDWDSVKGTQACLKYEILRIKWRDTIWGIPLYKRVLFIGTFPDGKMASRLADSLILTIIAYRTQLDETSSGLSQIYFSRITSGFELICSWVYEGVALEPSENEYICTLDVERMKGFIVEQASTVSRDTTG